MRRLRPAWRRSGGDLLSVLVPQSRARTPRRRDRHAPSARDRCKPVARDQSGISRIRARLHDCHEQLSDAGDELVSRSPQAAHRRCSERREALHHPGERRRDDGRKCAQARGGDRQFRTGRRRGRRGLVWTRARPRSHRLRRYGRHQLRHRAGRERRLASDHRGQLPGTAGQAAHHRSAHHRRWRRLDRVDRCRRRAQCRPALGGSGTGARLLRPRRQSSDRDRCQPCVRSARSEAVSRRPDAARRDSRQRRRRPLSADGSDFPSKKPRSASSRS